MKYIVLDLKTAGYVCSGSLERCQNYIKEMDEVARKQGKSAHHQIEELGKAREFVKIEREKVMDYIHGLRQSGYEEVESFRDFTLCKTDGIHFDYVDIEFD